MTTSITRTLKRTALAATAALTIAAAAAGAASASIGSTIAVAGLAFRAGVHTDPQCVSEARLATLDGRPAAGFSTLGLTDMNTGQMWFLNSVCDSLRGWEYSTAQTVKPQQLEALVTLYHEAAHYHGTRSERLAECAGVRGALGQIKLRYPWLVPLAKRWFLVDDEKYRPAAYKLNGTCPVAL
jgi:hypothetical protein